MSLDATTVDPSRSAAVTPLATPSRAIWGPSTPPSDVDTTEREFSFDDFLDVINPLQHLPIVSSIYREVTGDEIHGAARVLGGLLYGGVLGMVGGAVDAMLEETTGRDLGQNAVAAIFGEDAPFAGTGHPQAVAAAGEGETADASAGDSSSGGEDAAAGPAEAGIADPQAMAASAALAASTPASPPEATPPPSSGPAAPERTAALTADFVLGPVPGSGASLATAAAPSGTRAAAPAPAPVHSAVGAAPPLRAAGGPASGPIVIDSRVDAALSALASGSGGSVPAATVSPALTAEAVQARATAGRGLWDVRAAADRRSAAADPGSLAASGLAPGALPRGLHGYARGAQAGLPVAAGQTVNLNR